MCTTTSATSGSSARMRPISPALSAFGESRPRSDGHEEQDAVLRLDEAHLARRLARQLADNPRDGPLVRLGQALAGAGL